MVYYFSSHFIIDDLVCLFNGNLISSGGCLYIHLNNNIKLSTTNSINNSLFSSNSVLSGEGGAIYLHSSDLKLINTTIYNNTSLVGGGIKYVNLVPQFLYDKNVFIGGKWLV